MTDDDFIRTIAENPTDFKRRLVYADWLEERGDVRARYLRARVALEKDPSADPGLRSEMMGLRAQLSSAWLAAIADHYLDWTSDEGQEAVSADEPIARVAAALERPALYIDRQGYECEIVAGTIHPVFNDIAYVECRRQWRDQFHDINYYLRVRNHAGRESSSEIATYNPFFGCRIYFLQWFGDSALCIYEEKHDTYFCRFGALIPATFQVIEYRWVINGFQVGFQGYQETMVRRIAIPSLQELPPLSEEDARRADLFPRTES